MARRLTGEVLELDRKGGRTYALRFYAYGKRRYVTLGTVAEGWTRWRAEEELANVLADVRRGIWKPPARKAAREPRPEPTFHQFASEWIDARRHEFAPRTVEDYTLALTHHLLPFFAEHKLSEITAREVDRYKALKVRERELGLVKRPLSNVTINKTLTRLGQILDVAVRYELIDNNPVKTRVEKLREAEPRRVRLTGEQVQVLLRAAGPNRALLATAIMAGGLRISELTHLRWRDIDLRGGSLSVAASKTAAGVRRVVLDPELVQLLREHKMAAKWSQPDDFVFAGRIRSQPRERNRVRTAILYPAIERANELLAREGKPPIPEVITFHALRRTYAALRAELGEHPAITAAQMGHRDPRMTLRVYTDVTGMKPRTRLGGLLREGEWALMGTETELESTEADDEAPRQPPKTAAGAGETRGKRSGSDGTRTRGLRRDRPAL
jgi:integrase